MLGNEDVVLLSMLHSVGHANTPDQIFRMDLYLASIRLLVYSYDRMGLRTIQKLYTFSITTTVSVFISRKNLPISQ